MYQINFNVSFNVSKQEKGIFYRCPNLLKIMVIREGLEPSTQWLKAICSTD